ncbi:MAG: hypothetical protein QXL81_00290 [Candidatus Aenigmatarchaeota archaeon]
MAAARLFEGIIVSKIKSLVGFLKTFVWLTRSEWSEMDHKLLRLAIGIITFVFWAFFWLYFFRSSTPFG